MSTFRDHHNALIPTDAIVAVRAVLGRQCNDELAADVIGVVLPHLMRGMQTRIELLEKALAATRDTSASV
jgi:hypothetical protein